MRYNRDPGLMEVFRSYGSASNAADCFGVSRQAVSKWDRLPPKYLKQVWEEKKLHPYKVRPDLYIESYWNLGLNTAEIAERMGLGEPDVYKLIGQILRERREGASDSLDFALPAISEPPVEGN